MTREETTVPLIDTLRSQLISDVSQWTGEETVNILSPAIPKSPNIAKSKKIRILSADIQSSWKKYQDMRKVIEYENTIKHHRIDKEIFLKSKRLALRTASLARAAFVLEGIEKGVSMERANDIAGFEITKYGIQLNNEQAALPPYRLLDKPIEEAVDIYSQEAVYGRIQPTMRALIGLGTVAVIELGNKKNEPFVLPDHRPV